MMCRGCLVALAFTAVAAAHDGPEVCVRPEPGAAVQAPADLRATDGVLNVPLSLKGDIGPAGKKYCYIYRDSIEAPSLRVHPGDELVITLKNELRVPQTAAGQPEHHSAASSESCRGKQVAGVSTNLHFHGVVVPPVCGQDETLRTFINPNEPPFTYHVKIPVDQDPGLYWYHPHPHGYTEGQVLGGASGALIVEGIEKVNPKVAGLPERILILRDQIRPGDDDDDPKDLSLNFVPVSHPKYKPAELVVPPSRQEFWRVLNAAADTFYDIHVRYGTVPREQTLEIVAMDGVAVGAGASERTHILLSPGARVEFIITTPPEGTYAQLTTEQYYTGPDGTPNNGHVIANIAARPDAPETSQMPGPEGSGKPFTGLTALRPSTVRKLYFSEDLSDPDQAKYFVTFEGMQPKVFDMNSKEKSAVVRQATVEDWVIENRTNEAHSFHIHQVHFQLLERNGVKVDEAALRDTVDLPYWPGGSAPYPSVTVRIDFRPKQIVGVLPFHCHILEHQDGGMMGVIEVIRADDGNGTSEGHGGGNHEE